MCQFRFNKKKSQNVRVVFWNVENLYDPYDDTTTLDDEFTSAGAKHWSYSKFRRKLNLLAKTLITVGGWEPPAIVGMCEVENRYVLNKLIYETPLSSWKYRILHHESPDARGIDVAMIYRPDEFRIIMSKTVTIRFPFDTTAQTREILMVKGTIFDTDTLHIFVNHWPSRRGGYNESQPRRDCVAKILRKLADSVLMASPEANILMMGDFNDEPDKASIFTILGATGDTTSLLPGSLINLMFPKLNKEGTIKYQGNWSILDQFIISKSMYRGTNGLHSDFQDSRIIKLDFLFSDDQRYFGSKPNRTYVGPRYNGGFSDHLPIGLNIWHHEFHLGPSPQ
ncbi:MAG: endonuclease [bacterium]